MTDTTDPGQEDGRDPIDLTRRGALQMGATAAGLVAIGSTPAAAETTFTAGVARRDITPVNGGEFFGYVRPDMRAEGVATRLFAHALVLSDGATKLALVSVDLGAPMVKGAVLTRLADRGFDRNTVLLVATHTHVGPFIATDWIADQVADAVVAADESRRPARAGWSEADVLDANRSRSVGAHLANHGTTGVTPGSGSPATDPRGPDHTRTTTLRLLRVEAPDGTPIAAWSQFPVHPTAYTNDTTTFAADLAGAATRRFVASFPGASESDSGGEGSAPLAMFTNGTVGDLVPIYDEFNDHALADREGERIAEGMRRAWVAAGDHLSRAVPVAGRTETRTFDGQEVEPGKPVGRQAFWGTPFLGGAENGPSPFFTFGMQGKRRPEALADPRQGRKLIAAPAHYSADVEVQALQVGDRLLVTVPGEPSTEMGRRMRRAAAAAAPDTIADVAVLGIANGYNGYFTTPEEYAQQYYEGGHTVFGTYSSLLIRNAHRDLAATIEEGPAPDSGGGSRVPPSPTPPTGDGGRPGTITSQPAASVERMSVVRLAWTGGPLGRDRPVGEPFVRLERGSDGATVATDLGLGFVWREVPLGSGRYQVRYELPPDMPTGRYRLRVQSAQYDLPSRPFAVGPSTGLRPRGVRLSDQGNRLVLLAQNPAPDPATALRARAVQPTGGTATIEIDGRARIARWDADAGGWVAGAGGVSPGDTIRIPAGGLVDGLGNRSGEAVNLQVGDVAPVEWPPAMAPGGGKAPGPFGVGTFPP